MTFKTTLLTTLAALGIAALSTTSATAQDLAVPMPHSAGQDMSDTLIVAQARPRFFRERRGINRIDGRLNRQNRLNRRIDRRIERQERRFDRRARLRGYRGYRERRPGYRRYRGLWFPPAAFVIERALRSGNYSRRHHNWCDNKYRSYRRSDGTFQPYSGPRKRCNSPFDGV